MNNPAFMKWVRNVGLLRLGLPYPNPTPNPSPNQGSCYAGKPSGIVTYSSGPWGGTR